MAHVRNKTDSPVPLTTGGVLVNDLFGSTALPAPDRSSLPANSSPSNRRGSLLQVQQETLDELPAHVVAEKTAQAQSRLEMLSEVNRRLHRTLVDKKCLAETLREANTKMASRVNYRSVEVPAREKRIDELVNKLQGEQSHQQTGTLHMSKKILMLEEKIAALTAVNSELQDKHKKDRAVLSEQQIALKQKTKQVKELQKQIEFLEGMSGAGEFNKFETMSMSDSCSVVDSQLGRRDSYLSQSQDGTSPTVGSMKAAAQAPLTIDDYRKLPGMNLQLLLDPKRKTKP